jgi:hypothetical protein
MITRSYDQGKTWTDPQVVPNYDFYGMDDPGITQLSNGDLLVNAFRYHIVPKELARKNSQYGDHVFSQPFTWAHAPDGTFVFRSFDEGYTWAEITQINISPFHSGCTLRPIVELSNGTLLLPCYDEWREMMGLGPSISFVVKSKDGGKTWGEPSIIAEDNVIGFYEPALLALPDGKIIAMLRTHAPGDWHIYQCHSYDAGATWSEPKKTPIWGYPAHLLHLHDGRILCTYGHRKFPYGIRACLSYDNGEKWDIKNEIIIRDDLPNADLGYPTSIQLEDGTIFTVYYGQDEDGVTCIQGSFYRIMGVR